MDLLTVENILKQAWTFWVDPDGQFEVDPAEYPYFQ